MKAIVRAGLALVGLFALSGCGSSGGSCGGVTMQTATDDGSNWQLSASVTNSSDDPKLVSITVVNPKGEIVATDGPFRVSAKDVVQRDDVYDFGLYILSGPETVAQLESEGWKFNLKCE